MHACHVEALISDTVQGQIQWLSGMAAIGEACSTELIDPLAFHVWQSSTKDRKGEVVRSSTKAADSFHLVTEVGFYPSVIDGVSYGGFYHNYAFRCMASTESRPKYEVKTVMIPMLAETGAWGITIVIYPKGSLSQKHGIVRAPLFLLLDPTTSSDSLGTWLAHVSSQLSHTCRSILRVDSPAPLLHVKMANEKLRDTSLVVVRFARLVLAYCEVPTACSCRVQLF